MTDAAPALDPTGLKPPAFVTFFSAGLNGGLTILTLYGPAHDALGQSPVPVTVACLAFRPEDLKAMAGLIGGLLDKVGWTEPAPPSTPASEPQGKEAEAPAPRVKPLPPMLVANFTASYVDGMVIATFFGLAQDALNRPPIFTPLVSAALKARDARGLAGLVGDLLRQGEIMVKLHETPTTGVQ